VNRDNVSNQENNNPFNLAEIATAAAGNSPKPVIIPHLNLNQVEFKIQEKVPSTQQN
jgi:hypothetical protein